MNERPETKIVTCPECGELCERSIVWFGEREIFADRGCLCDACEKKRADAVAAVNETARHQAHWRNQCPDDYHRTELARVPAAVLTWRPTDGCRRLGIHGKPGAGKSMAAAALALKAGLRFAWTNGFAARSLYNNAVTLEGEDRKAAAAAWLKLSTVELLILDDVDKGNFKEAWALALFDLLETRNSKLLPTVWTANHGPGALAAKFAKCGDAELADAIERRLVSGAKIISL